MYEISKQSSNYQKETHFAAVRAVHLSPHEHPSRRYAEMVDLGCHNVLVLSLHPYDSTSIIPKVIRSKRRTYYYCTLFLRFGYTPVGLLLDTVAIR